MCVFLALGPVPVPTAGLECFAWSQSHQTQGHSYSACVGWEGADKHSPRHPWQAGSRCCWVKGGSWARSLIFQETQRKLSLRMSGPVLKAVTLGVPGFRADSLLPAALPSRQGSKQSCWTSLRRPSFPLVGKIGFWKEPESSGLTHWFRRASRACSTPGRQGEWAGHQAPTCLGWESTRTLCEPYPGTRSAEGAAVEAAPSFRLEETSSLCGHTTKVQ